MAITKIHNAQGLDIRKSLQPKSVNYVQEMNYNQKEFGLLLGIPQSTLSAYETDRMQPTVAEFICSYFKKGSPLALSGSLRIRRYLDKDGNKRTATEVVASDVYFAGSNKASSDQPASAADVPLPEPPSGYEEYADSVQEALDGDDDYPFKD